MVWRASVFLPYLPRFTATGTAASSRNRKSGYPDCFIPPLFHNNLKVWIFPLYCSYTFRIYSCMISLQASSFSLLSEKRVSASLNCRMASPYNVGRRGEHPFIATKIWLCPSNSCTILGWTSSVIGGVTRKKVRRDVPAGFSSTLPGVARARAASIRGEPGGAEQFSFGEEQEAEYTGITRRK